MGHLIRREAWDRQKGEPSKAYSYFQSYRDLGRDRSVSRLLEDVAKALTEAGKDVREVSVTSRQVFRYSSRYRWVDRCEAYDTYLDGLRRKKTERERIDASDRHAKAARALENLVIRKLMQWTNEVPNMSPVDAARIFECAARIERLALGEPTEISKNEVTNVAGGRVDFTKMTAADRRSAMLDTLLEMGKSEQEAERLVNELLGSATITPLIQ